MGLFKPKIQDARRAAESVPGMAGKFTGLAWDLLGDAILSIQISVYHVQTGTFLRDILDEVQERSTYIEDELLKIKTEQDEQGENFGEILKELRPDEENYHGFYQDVADNFSSVNNKLDGLLEAIGNGGEPGEEEPPPPPPPPPPVDENCKMMAEAMLALSKKQFKVDYLLIKKMVTEAIQPTLAKVNQIDSRTITIESDVKKLGKNNNDSIDLKPVHERLIKLSTDIKEVKKDTTEVKEAFKVPLKGSVRLWVKDKKPKLFPYEGKGITGVASFLNAIENQNFHIQELINLIEVGSDETIPETWHGKALDAIPQLILKYAIATNDGKRGRANYKVTIPHYAGAKMTKSPIPLIQKGNYYAIITLRDGTKCTTYCATQAEAGKFVNAALRIIPKSFHKSPLDYTIGIRTTVQRKRVRLVCRGAVYLSQGSKNTAPDWSVDFA